MLRKIRTSLAIISLTVLTLLFLDFSGTLHLWLGWIADIQLIPAILAVNVIAIVFLLVLTLVLGRVYCSAICPLGIYQDIVSWLSGKRKKNRFTYSKALNWLRYIFLGLFVIALVLGVSSIVSLLDPYSAYGRITSNLFAPVYQWGNNFLAYLAEKADSYTFYAIDVWMKSLITLIVAIISLVLVTVLAWRHGRTYCNSICPVGTFLGLLSRFSLFKPVIDTSVCNSCGLCTRNCKSSCIDTESHAIDYSRCVVCFDCIDKCAKGAIKYKPVFELKKKEETVQPITAQTDTVASDRRKFISAATLFGLSGMLGAQEKIREGGLAVIEDKKIPKRAVSVVPPGSIGLKNLNKHCTSCGLCISACPNGVLRPTSKLSTFMQPEMSYERGYCRPECTACSDVCPTGAINRITTADKSATQIGYAVWIRDNCVVLTDDVDCGNCEVHCPTGAIQMVSSDPENPKARKIPTVDTERCIGCGACEYLCPARPFSAIYVEGVEKHRMV